MDNAQDEETARRWKELETVRDQEHERNAGLMDMYAEVREIAPPKRRRIENRSTTEQLDPFASDPLANDDSVTMSKVKATSRKRTNGG